MPAQATANSVIASAKRLIELRHDLPQQQQNGRDQRSGVADTDPPDEVDDGESPADRDVHAPNANALVEQPADRQQKPLQNQEADCDMPEHPAVGDRAGAARSRRSCP